VSLGGESEGRQKRGASIKMSLARHQSRGIMSRGKVKWSEGVYSERGGGKGRSEQR